MEICCKRKRDVYIFSRESGFPKLKTLYMKYCKMLNKVLKGAKR
jgi:hypothetical protein